MATAADQGFESLEVDAVSCGAHVGLDGLRYGWPVGFARYVLEAVKPRGSGMSPGQRDELGEKLGCPVREIKCHI